MLTFLRVYTIFYEIPTHYKADNIGLYLNISSLASSFSSPTSCDVLSNGNYKLITIDKGNSGY